MTGRLLALITGVVVAAFLAVAAIAAVGSAASACMLPASSGSASGYDTEQLHNTAIIVQVANQRGLPIRAAVIALATAMQESNLYNSDQATNHDSLGLFQQRPSQGWGTPQQLLNPEYAAGTFYDTLLTVANWQSLPLTLAAQAVQRSANGNAYAKHEADATAIVAHVGSGGSSAIPGDLQQCLSNCPPVLSSDAADLLRHEQTANGSAGTPGSSAAKLLTNQQTASSKLVLTPSESAARRPAIAHDHPEPTAQTMGDGLTDAAAAVGPCGNGCPAITTSTGSGGGCAGLDAVFARARSWLTAWPGGGPVPYLSSNASGDLFGGYRRDCSGYVSMALGLPGPGLDTITLAAHSTIIGKADLRPGGLMIKPAPGGAGHVVLFAGWTDASMSSYWGYEQSGDGGTHYRRIPFPYFGTYTMTPYRLRN